MLGTQPVANAEGLIAERPSAAAVSARYVWFSRDINQFSISDGTQWLDFRAMQTVVAGHMESRLLDTPQLTLQGYAGIPTERIEFSLESDSSGGGGAAARYVQDFVNQTSVVVPFSSHMKATKGLIVQLYDDTGNQIGGDIAINVATFTVTITFVAAQSGYLVIL